MSKGIEIAQERLARGEISEEEYDKIVNKLQQSKSQPASPLESPEPDMPETATSSSSDSPTFFEDKKEKSEAIKNWSIFAALYIILCAIFTFGFTKGDTYESVLKGCGSNSAFCHCVAESYAEQKTFFLAPFQTFGLLIDKSAGAHCRK